MNGYDESTSRWDNFQALVSWAAWKVVEGLLRGDALRVVMHEICMTVRQAKFKGEK